MPVETSNEHYAEILRERREAKDEVIHLKTTIELRDNHVEYLQGKVDELLQQSFRRDKLL